MTNDPEAAIHRDMADELRKIDGAIVVDFGCGRCSEIAATMALVPPRHQVPEGPPLDLEPASGIHREGWTLWVDALATVHGPLAPGLVEGIRSGLEGRDSAALFELAADDMSFFCPRCASWYCSKHWTLETFFDEGNYDFTKGTCPRRHRRKVDD